MMIIENKSNTNSRKESCTVKEYKLVAPDIDRLLCYFDQRYLNPSSPTSEVAAAMDPLFTALSDLAPLPQNDEVKAIWLQVPRGGIEDYDSYDDMLAYGEVESREEYEERWREDYPDKFVWYELVIVESFNKDGSLRFRGVSLDHKSIISAIFDRTEEVTEKYSDEAAVLLCQLLTSAVAEPLAKLRSGTYNEEVELKLPYQFRTGVIKRSVLWEKSPEWRENELDGLSVQTVSDFKKLLESGINDEEKIGRIPSFTANDFFRACVLGYKALGYDCGEKKPSELYVRYADGRDEGLTGTGHGLNEGPGIDFDDPDAWDEWYFSNRGGGHPWEIIRGGNSTHVDLFVQHDKRMLEWKYRTGEITDGEYNERLKKAGYYFIISGKHRPKESVTFYTVLSAAGLPVVLNDAEEILARFEATDYVGIVPRHVVPKYCEGMFPEKYGQVIDFMHVFDEDIAEFGTDIEWLPEEPARLIDSGV